MDQYVNKNNYLVYSNNKGNLQFEYYLHYSCDKIKRNLLYYNYQTVVALPTN